MQQHLGIGIAVLGEIDGRQNLAIGRTVRSGGSRKVVKRGFGAQGQRFGQLQFAPGPVKRREIAYRAHRREAAWPRQFLDPGQRLPMEFFALGVAALCAQHHGDILQGQCTIEAGALAGAVEGVERAAVGCLGLRIVRRPVELQGLRVPCNAVGSGEGKASQDES